MMKQPDPKTYTEAEMITAMNGSVGGRIMAAIAEWQNARAACIKPSVTQDEISRLASAEAALAAVVCK